MNPEKNDNNEHRIEKHWGYYKVVPDVPEPPNHFTKTWAPDMQKKWKDDLEYWVHKLLDPETDGEGVAKVIVALRRVSGYETFNRHES